METFFHNSVLIAIRISTIQKGSNHVTEKDQPLQVITFKYPKGTYLPSHIHVPKKRTTPKLQECLVVKKGRLKINLYTTKKEPIRSIILKAGEILIMTNGGYGIHITEDSEFMEFKNGPYVEDKVLI